MHLYDILDFPYHLQALRRELVIIQQKPLIDYLIGQSEIKLRGTK